MDELSRWIVARAKVKGHSMPWYRLKVEFERFDAEVSERVYGLIESKPMLLARIEAGKLPAEQLDRLRKERIDLIPRNWDEMRRSCDCPDWGDPCKHMAAVYYTLAKEVDRDSASTKAHVNANAEERAFSDSTFSLELEPAAALSAWLPEQGELATKKRVELREDRLVALRSSASGPSSTTAAWA
jgi:hypothetical protein